MRFITSLILVAAIMGATSAVAGPEPVKSPAAVAADNPSVEVKWANAGLAAECNGGEPSALWQGWFHGGEYDRAAAINTIRNLRDAESLNVTNQVGTVRSAADCLRRFYGMRAGRKQVLLDTESTAVFVGGLGALLSGGAGATTQKYWTYGAVAPVIIAQLSASQPVRDLYAGGRIGLDVIGLRYHELDRMTSQLEIAMGFSDKDQLTSSSFNSACLKLVGNRIEQWATEAETSKILTAYKAVKPACIVAASDGAPKLPSLDLNVACLYLLDPGSTWSSADVAKVADYENLRRACVSSSLAGSRAYPGFKAACLKLRGVNMEGKWTEDADKIALLPDYRKLVQACTSAEKADYDLVSGLRAAKGWRNEYRYNYAEDLLRLDDEILHKDRQLRYSPVQTLSAMAAAPFTAAATLLSGENGGQAIDRLKTQQAFSAMNVPLSPILLPPSPSPFTDVYVLSDAALIRRTVINRAGQLSDQQVNETLDQMQAVVDGLNDARGGLNHQIRLANRIALLATYDRLDFSYDATTVKVSVVLMSSQTPPSIPASPGAGR